MRNLSLKFLSLFFVFTVVNGCDSVLLSNIHLEENSVTSNPDNILRVGTIHQRISYRKTHGNIEGLEADFLNQYAQDRELKIVFIKYKSQEDVLAALENNEIDVGAARFQKPMKALQGPIYDKENHMFLISRSEFHLRNDMLRWFQVCSREGVIGRIMDRYHGYRNYLDSMDISAFKRAAKNRLPAYLDTFKKFANEFSLPWKLVTAVAYQESSWNPMAVSYTGVKGLMQLTRDTASFVGIEDRQHPEQSIWGGAKYLRYLLDRQPEHLAYRERLSLALAAYNIGMAHLQDAQIVAESEGLDPYAWKDVKTILPRLENPEYAANLRYGMARGNETVDFVNRVLSYNDLL